MIASKQSAATVGALALWIAAFSLAWGEDTASKAANIKDPGLRGGPPNAGGPLPDIQVNELKLFNEAILRANELESTCETCSDVPPGTDTREDPLLVTLTNSAGLGARFNGDQCSVCHNQPAVGGSGGFMVPNPQDAKIDPRRAMRPENPMFRLIPQRKGASNVAPSFIKQFGPIREARFKFKPDGTRDGGVHQLFTIVGRTDDPSVNCHIQQPDFEGELAKNNVTFRIPLQLFGLGLIDTIEDREILKRHADSAALRNRFGIAGRPNRSGNDGTITRFGWKAQNKSLTVFSGEAYNVEMGVTNELFPQAVEDSADCNVDKPHPNDITRTATNDDTNDGFDNPLHILADWMQFTFWMRFLDAPQPVALTTQANRGKQIFSDAGCVGCHTATMVTAGRTLSAATQGRTANLYSDLLIHHMGKTLADNIVQGEAGVDEFRTTPLWGIGKRIFFLHDGRTSDLVEAIRAHSSPAAAADTAAKLPALPASEANASVKEFFALPKADQQALLAFLRSL